MTVNSLKVWKKQGCCIMYRRKKNRMRSFEFLPIFQVHISALMTLSHTSYNNRCKNYKKLLVLMMFPLIAFSQKADSTWIKLIQKAEDYKLKRSYDIALSYALNAVEISKKKQNEADHLTSHALIIAGECYLKKSKPQQAHQYFTKALQNARKFNHSEERRDAYLSINQLHKLIIQNDWDFPYKAPDAVIEADVYYSIENVETDRDSILVTIYGGRLDGITDSSLAGGIYTRRNTNKETLKREGGYFIGSADIINVSANRTTLRMPLGNDTLPIKGDLVKISSNIPLAWNGLPYKTSLLQNVVWTDNYNQRIYDRRYLYYFTDSFTTTDIGEAFKYAVEEVLPIVAGDTVAGKQFSPKFKDGLFRNLNMYEALQFSKPEHYNYFQNYALKYGDSYRGNDYRFSEVYATWVLNNAPMLADDIKEFLTAINSAKRAQAFCRFLDKQITEQQLPTRWFDDGMHAAYLDDIKQARSLARLLYDYGIGTNQPAEEGWACYLEAVCLHKLGITISIDSLLNVCNQYFEQSNNQEGLLWVKNGRESLFEKPSVSFSVQSGHLMPFHMAVSPNSRFFATGSDDHSIKIWDIYTAKEVRTIYGHNKEVTDVAFSPGGRYLASCSDDSTIKIWNGFNYQLMKTIKMNDPDGKIIFSPDSKKIIGIGADSGIRIWNAFTGKLLQQFKAHEARLSDITFLPEQDNMLVSAGRDSMIYFWNIDSAKKEGYIKTKGKLIRARFSNNGKFMYTTFTDSTISVWKTGSYTRLFTNKIQAGKTLSGTFLNQPTFTPDSKYIIYVNDKGKRVIEDLETLYFRTYDLTSRGEFIQEQYVNKDGSFLIEKAGVDGMMRILDFSNYSFLKGFTAINSTEIKQYQNPPVSIQFSKNDSALYVLGFDLNKLDLSNGTTTSIAKGMQVYYPNQLVLKNEDVTVYLSSTYDTLKMVNYKTNNLLHSFPSYNKEKIRSYEISSDQQYCFLGTEKGSISAWDINKEVQLFKNKYGTGEDSVISSLTYDSLYQRLVIILKNSGAILLHPLTGKTIHTVKDSTLQKVALSNSRLFITNDKGVQVYDRKSLSFIKAFTFDNEKDFEAIAYSPASNQIIVSGSNGSLIVADANNGKIIYKKKEDSFEISDIELSNDNSLMAVSSFNNKINLYEFQTGNLLLKVHTPLFTDMVLNDADGNYMASKKSLNGIVFNYNDGAYDFEQFDLQYNRPDLVLKHIGKADTSLIQSYFMAYKKRLKRNGISENDLSTGLNLPVIRIPDKSQIRPVTSAPEYTFTVECFEPKYKLQSIHVLVNNTPVYGIKGYNLQTFDTFQVTKKLTVPLSIGNNAIKIYCVNNKGISSLKEAFDVYANYKSPQPAKVYFIGIAVANYKDRNFNLRYSAKDVRDLAQSVKKIYPAAEIDTLIDAMATREHVLSLKQKLSHTTVNDKVIMAVTGHGLLSDSLDFYYGTYDVDFNKPVTNGLKYDELENLLTDIPARQKLLMIDACHSGALDKESILESKQLEMSAGNNNQNESKVTTSRSSIKIKPSKINLNNTFELMQNLFADLSTSNGTIVISAAGGLEYAFESPEWNNGVFTYCVRKGLEEKEADKDGGNYDGSVSVQELQQYVSRKVAELTAGKQRPTSRRENLDNDWNLR